jgi:hypothetical protein
MWYLEMEVKKRCDEWSHPVEVEIAAETMVDTDPR